MENKVEFIKNHFSWVIAFVCLSLFSFNFWLFYPGYLTHDYVGVITNFTLNNWQPVIYSVLLKKLFFLFGNHFYFLLLFNLVPFYFGLYILTSGFWKKFHSQWCWFGLFPIFIGNIYFNNLFMHCSFASPMIIFLLWSILLYQILVGITYKNLLIAIFAFILALLSRHNAIIQVYPVFFVYSYLIIKQTKPSYMIFKYIGLLFLLAIMTILISFGIPNAFKEKSVYPTQHIFLHQIAAVCVPQHDASCFKSDWYDKNKSYTNVEDTYIKFPLNADYMNREWYPEHPFKNIHQKLDNLFRMWLKSIKRYPKNYFSYIESFRKEQWNSKTFHYEPDLNKNIRCTTPRDCDSLQNTYPSNILYYKPSLSKVKIFNFLKYLPNIPTNIFIWITYILFFISGFLFLRKKDILLLYTLSSSTAGIAGSIIFCIFSPVPIPRYIYPVIVSTLTSTIGIILHFCTKTPILECNIEKTNFKEMIKKSKKALIVISILIILYSVYAYINAPLKARADVYAPYNDTPYFVVHQNNVPQPAPEASWMPKSRSRGVVIQEYGNSINFTITALEDTSITIALRGPDERDANGKRYEKWVKYTSFKINGLSVMPNNQDVWHDQPFKYTFNAKKHNTYKVKLKYRKK